MTRRVNKEEIYRLLSGDGIDIPNDVDESILTALKEVFPEYIPQWETGPDYCMESMSRIYIRSTFHGSVRRGARNTRGPQHDDWMRIVGLMGGNFSIYGDKPDWY